MDIAALLNLVNLASGIVGEVTAMVHTGHAALSTDDKATLDAALKALQEKTERDYQRARTALTAAAAQG